LEPLLPRSERPRGSLGSNPSHIVHPSPGPVNPRQIQRFFIILFIIILLVSDRNFLGSKFNFLTHSDICVLLFLFLA
jgi:hypothetical protein